MNLIVLFVHMKIKFAQINFTAAILVYFIDDTWSYFTYILFLIDSL